MMSISTLQEDLLKEIRLVAMKEVAWVVVRPLNRIHCPVGFFLLRTSVNILRLREVKKLSNGVIYQQLARKV